MLSISRFKTAVQSRLRPDTRTYKALAWTYRLMSDSGFRRKICRSTVMAVRKDSRFAVAGMRRMRNRPL
jgi:hypothetical protein